MVGAGGFEYYYARTTLVPKDEHSRIFTNLKLRVLPLGIEGFGFNVIRL